MEVEFGGGGGNKFEDFFPFPSALAETLVGSMTCLSEGSISC